MKKMKKIAKAALAVFIGANMLVMTGCGTAEKVDFQTDMMEADDVTGKEQPEILEEREKFGWKVYLCDLTDWQEYQAKGEIGYDVQFDNVEQIKDLDDLFAYHCMVNAVDGSICGAYSGKGIFGDNDIWYEY